MLLCASPFVVAAYAKVRFTPQGSRALPADSLQSRPQLKVFFDFLRRRHFRASLLQGVFFSVSFSGRRRCTTWPLFPAPPRDFPSKVRLIPPALPMSS